MMLLSTRWIILCLCAFGFVHCSSHAQDQEQVNLGRNQFNPPLTITVRGEASVSRTAEIANLEVSISVSDISRDVAVSKAFARFGYTLDLLRLLSPGADTSAQRSTAGAVERFSASPLRVREHAGSHKSKSIDKDRSSLVDASPEYHASARVCIRFRQLEPLCEFAKNITNWTDVTIDWVDWELSEKTRAAAKTELRIESFKSVLQASEDYAKALGLRSLTALEFEEEYIMDTSDMPGRFIRGFDNGDDEVIDLHAPKMRMTTNVKCLFTTAQ